MDSLERFRQQKKAVGPKWRRGETDVRVSGKRQYCYRAVDSEGKTVDCLLCDKPDHAAALSFFQQAIDQHGRPEGVTIDKSGSNQSALAALSAEDAPTVNDKSNYQCIPMLDATTMDGVQQDIPFLSRTNGFKQ